MAWVIGIREVRHVEVQIDDTRLHGPRPRVKAMEVVDLPASAFGRTIRGGPPTFLPAHTGAGPCGTHARRERLSFHGVPILFDNEVSPLAWSIQHLVEPLAAYYAAYEPPRRFGAKDTPRGRRCRCEES